jgi:nicotinamidase-related amidase
MTKSSRASATSQRIRVYIRGAGAVSQMSLLERGQATLVVVDVQEAFRPYDCFAQVAANCAKLIQGARILDVPRVVSEQYPKGLGHTAPEVGLADEVILEKSVFSAARAEGFDRSGIGQQGRRQAVVCGIETHVCVSQTVHDLLAEGVEVHVPADAVGSRHALDYERGLERLVRAGAVVTTVEAVLFELLERAGTPEFKAVQGLVK